MTVEPVTEPTVTKLERQVRRGLMPSLVLAPGVQDGTPDVEGWYAAVDFGRARLECSKLDGEDGWTVDALWNPGPVFVNGFGARYLATKAPSDKIAQVLDTALAARTVTTKPERTEESQ